MQRTAIAAATSMMGLAMFYLCHAAGFISFAVFANAAGAGFVLMGLFVFSYPLVRSSRLELRDSVVYMNRSRAFLAILLGLLALRLALHDFIGHLISPLQTASLFYRMAFGMIARWRLGMYGQSVRMVPDRPAPRAGEAGNS